MAHEVDWNRPIYEEFKRIAILTEEEDNILLTRIQGFTIQEQAKMFHMSRGKVKVIIRRLKDKYDDAQKYSDILPVRRHSREETYMDRH